MPATNPLSNRISMDMPPEVRAKVMALITELRDTLAPFLVDLKVEDRQDLTKLGDKTRAMVMKAQSYMAAHPDLKPAFIDLVEVGRDTAAMEILGEMFTPLKQLTRQLQDSLMLASHEAYGAALVFYTACKSAARINMPNAQSIAQDLGTCFARKSSAAGAPPAPSPSA